jgi:RHS repeat-associated protein
VSSLNPAPGERAAVAVTSGLSAGRVRVVSSQVVDVELFVVGVYVTSITPTLTPASAVGPSGLVFDPLGRLTTTVTGGVTVEYSYLADGTRVAARTQGGAQVYYLGGIEATRTTGGVWSQVRRTYPYGGVTVASRTTTPSGTGVSWLLGDRQGSITTTITAGTATTRWYLPYGGRRGPAPGTVPTTTGFLGKHEDGSGLTHLEHRDYDPTTGVFITIDPLVATTGDPYSYAAGNPTTLSDPNGLSPWGTDDWLLNMFFGSLVHSMIQADYMRQYNDAYAEVAYETTDLDFVPIRGRVDIGVLDPGNGDSSGVRDLGLNEIRPNRESAESVLARREREIWSGNATKVKVPGQPWINGAWSTSRDDRPYTAEFNILGVDVRARRDGPGVITYDYDLASGSMDWHRLLPLLRRANEALRNARGSNVGARQADFDSYESRRPSGVPVVAKAIGAVAAAGALVLLGPEILAAAGVGGGICYASGLCHA